MKRASSRLKKHIARWLRAIWPTRQNPRIQRCLEMILSNQDLSNDAARMIEGVLDIADLQARDIMLPRAKMIMLADNMSLDEIQNRVVESGHSRFPVMADNRDQIQGVLLAKDVLKHMVQQDGISFDLHRMLRPAVFVPESKRLNALLKEFRQHHNHLAVVVDEYGGVAGMVTIEDILEQIVGDIEDEYDDENHEQIKQIGPSKYIVPALTSIEAFNDTLQANFSADRFDTIGGLVTHALGRVAKKSDRVNLSGFEFTVLHTSQKHIRLLRVKRIQRLRAI